MDLETLHVMFPFRSPPTDWVTVFFDEANKVTDLLISFYLSNPRTFFAILLCTVFVLYYLRNIVEVTYSNYHKWLTTLFSIKIYPHCATISQA